VADPLGCAKEGHLPGEVMPRLVPSTQQHRMPRPDARRAPPAHRPLRPSRPTGAPLQAPRPRSQTAPPARRSTCATCSTAWASTTRQAGPGRRSSQPLAPVHQHHRPRASLALRPPPLPPLQPPHTHTLWSRGRGSRCFPPCLPARPPASPSASSPASSPPPPSATPPQEIVALSGAHTLGRARPDRSGMGRPPGAQPSPAGLRGGRPASFGVRAAQQLLA
jgi:hypothetical protein